MTHRNVSHECEDMCQAYDGTTPGRTDPDQV